MDNKMQMIVNSCHPTILSRWGTEGWNLFYSRAPLLPCQRNRRSFPLSPVVTEETVFVYCSEFHQFKAGAVKYSTAFDKVSAGARGRGPLRRREVLVHASNRAVAEPYTEVIAIITPRSLTRLRTLKARLNAREAVRLM